VSKQWLVIGAVVVIALLAYFMLAGKSANTPSPTSYPTQSPAVSATEESTTGAAMTKPVTVALQAENESSESGIATLTEVNGKVQVSVMLTGAPAAVTQPAHIHVGICPGVGEVKYPLTSVSAGKSETTIETTLASLKAALPLAINIHKSTSEPATYVSCGELSF